MATVLAYGSPALGHVYPLAALLTELADRGHDVHVRTMAREVATMRAAGFRAEAVSPGIEEIRGNDRTTTDAREVLAMSIDVLCGRAALEVDDIRAAIAHARPDVVIVDANCWGAMAAVEAEAVPWVVFSPFTPYLRSRGVPPFGPGLRPWPGLPGQLRDAVMRRVIRRMFDEPALRRLNPLRAEVGAAQVDSVDAMMRRAPLLLAVGGRPFEYPHPDWEDRVSLIGACSYEPGPGGRPPWLAEIDRPIVLVNTSSVEQADTILASTALRALADEPVHVVATFPAGVPPGLPQPSNATICEFIPHGAVLDRAVCVVTHGGMGSTVKALERGIPVCVVPFARDQAEVARRVQMARCGTRLPAKHLGPARLRRKVRQAMTMSEGARRVAAGFAATGGVARGADLMEQQVLSTEAPRR
ncbi:glycosyltransferase [Mycolicibacterium goodii]|uniref:Glycosyl transferase n=1 Tax=Mycolicibacterium goodii TaxID=134601 RepID=A0A0K0XCC8_MYCGD|nr:glycosyl transferase [Mycolicibacterium goodii]